MAFALVTGRLRVKLDAGEKDRGIIVESNCPGNRSLIKPLVFEPWPAPPPTPEDYTHIVFAPEMTTEVEIGGETFVVMALSAVLGTLD